MENLFRFICKNRSEIDIMMEKLGEPKFHVSKLLK